LHSLGGVQTIVKLHPDKLAAHLAKGLAPLYVICGDEPLAAGEAADAIRAAARAEGYDERESDVVGNASKFKWQECFSGLDNLSLFASRRIFELRIPGGKPGREGGAVLTELAGAPPADTLIIIHLPRLESKSKSAKWVKSLQQGSVWIEVAEPDISKLPGWLNTRAKQLGLQLERDAAMELAARTEGNLLAAQQELERLSLLMPGQTVSAEVISGSVADGARFDPFQLTDAALAQDVGRALRILFGLWREGVANPLIVWALGREAVALLNLWVELQTGAQVGQALQKHRIWDKRQPGYKKALRAHDEASVRRLMASAARADRVCKGAEKGSPRSAVLELVLALAKPGQVVLRSA
jgi:DNA polymerase-3 subunit delta